MEREKQEERKKKERVANLANLEQARRRKEVSSAIAPSLFASSSSSLLLLSLFLPTHTHPLSLFPIPEGRYEEKDGKVKVVKKGRSVVGMS